MGQSRAILQKLAAIGCSLLLIPLGMPMALAQSNLPPTAQPTTPLLTGDQLDNLVAPVALYPDPLLSEVLAASTYPLEVVEADQWLQQNQNVHGEQLMDAAKRQNWDPSIQALVAFPDALRLLNSDVRWTTDLGNAFLAQQSDVMAAVQRMRTRAQANGKLTTNAQQVVTTETQNGQNAIEIQPADPQVIYVPVYSPYYVWGPPLWPAYAGLWYPGIGFGFGFGPACYIGTFFGGWGGWGGWGWGFNWFGGGLFVNAGFFHSHGFVFRGNGFRGGRVAWAHNPGHRLGVPYANRQVANRFGGSFAARGSGGRFNGAGISGSRANAFRSGATGGWRSLSGTHGAAGNVANANRGVNPAVRGGERNFSGAGQSYRGFSSNGAQGFNRSGAVGSNPGARSFTAPRTPSAPHYSAPQFSGRSFSGGSGARSFGGGGGRSFGGGGHSFGGGGGHMGGGGHGGRR